MFIANRDPDVIPPRPNNVTGISVCNYVFPPYGDHFMEIKWLSGNCRESPQHLVVNSISWRNHGFNGLRTDQDRSIRQIRSLSVKSAVSPSFSKPQDIGVSHGNSQRPKNTF